jgi:CheY-like chemotaxis protein
MQEEDIQYIADKKLAAKKTILLVDDDEDEHEIFSSALKKAGEDYKFVSANSCEKALCLLKELEPDYIFIDVNMPRTDGMVCLQEIKKMSRMAQVPVYIYSTGINAKEGTKAVQLGAVDYILKPNSISTLSAVLRKILG